MDGKEGGRMSPFFHVGFFSSDCPTLFVLGTTHRLAIFSRRVHAPFSAGPMWDFFSVPHKYGVHRGYYIEDTTSIAEVPRYHDLCSHRHVGGLPRVSRV